MGLRRLEPLRSVGLLLALLPRRPWELRDRVAGYANLGLERFFGKSPSYETVSWEEALRDVEAQPERARSILEESALAGIEEGTRRLLEDIRPEDPFSQRWAVALLLPVVPPDRAFRRGRDRGGLRRELSLHPEGPRSERPRDALQRGPTAPEERGREVLGCRRAGGTAGPVATPSRG